MGAGEASCYALSKAIFVTDARKPDPKCGQVGGRGSAEQARGREGRTHSANWPLWLLLAWVLAASVGQTHVLRGPNAHLAQESEQLTGGARRRPGCHQHQQGQPGDQQQWHLLPASRSHTRISLVIHADWRHAGMKFWDTYSQSTVILPSEEDTKSHFCFGVSVNFSSS